MTDTFEVYRTKIWNEVAEPENPFAARTCYCAGYDVYGDLLGKARWSEYVYLMFKGERPQETATQLVEALALVLAHPGIRDHSVRAAMNAGVGGSTNAACLMAALGIGAGQYGGAHEVALALELWTACETDISEWEAKLTSTHKRDEANSDQPNSDQPTNDQSGAERWRAIEHPPGFDPHGNLCPLPVLQALGYLASIHAGGSLAWLLAHRERLEAITGYPLNIAGVAAAAFHDLDFTVDQAEMLFLILRLPGAAVHALEQKHYGWRLFPFFKSALHLTNDPMHAGK